MGQEALIVSRDIETVQIEGVSFRFSKNSCCVQFWAAGLNLG